MRHLYLRQTNLESGEANSCSLGSPFLNLKIILRALYILDPVGTYADLHGLHCPPTRFLGFPCHRVAGADRIRVVVMYAEKRFFFMPNMYDEPGVDHRDVDLVQVPFLFIMMPTHIHSLPFSQRGQAWFPGVHRDAWGPSLDAINVLALILSDLSDLIRSPDLFDILDLLYHWNGHPSYEGHVRSHRRQPRASQNVHESLLVPICEVEKLAVSEKELHLREMLTKMTE